MWVLWAVIDRLSPEGPRRTRGEDREADEQAIRLLAAGDADALGPLYDRHSRPVFALVSRIVEDQGEAEDVVQEVFSQAWRQASRYDASRGSVAAWLLMMARSRAIDRVRSRRAQPDGAQLPEERTAIDLPDPGAGQEIAVLTDEQIQRLRIALEKLPLVQRLAIELAYYEGLSQTEIAARLEQPLGTVKTRIRLGLLKLRDELAEVRS